MTNRCCTSIPLALALLAVAPAAAVAAPQIQVDRDCYLDTVVGGERIAPKIALSGNQFTPNAQYQISIDGQPLSGGSGSFDAAGAFLGTFSTSPLAGFDVRQRTWTVRVDEGANSASTSFRTSDIFADFSPTRGNPSALRVRWKAYGFKLAQADPSRDPAVYLHYIRPNGKRRLTVKLGIATGACGRLASTSKRRLFPFKAERGTWKLQVDTNKVFRRGRPSSPFIHYTVGVRVTRG